MTLYLLPITYSLLPTTYQSKGGRPLNKRVERMCVAKTNGFFKHALVKSWYVYLSFYLHRGGEILSGTKQHEEIL